MNCYECGGTYQVKTDLLGVDDPYVGTIAIDGVTYYQCDQCDDILYTEETSRAIEEERNKRIHEILIKFPIGDFISATETASMLDISRQALHKNRRISHGFIYQTKFAGVVVYLKPSALQFKKTGDGRFPLCPYRYNPSATYVEDTISMQLAPIYDLPRRTAVFGRLQFQKSYRSLKENCYAN